MAPAESIHICQGVRANGLIGVVQRALGQRKLRQWVVMETIEDAGWRGALKRLEYSRIYRMRKKTLQGILAIGHRTVDWVTARGASADSVYPFSYFLPATKAPEAQTQRKPGPFRFVFAGQLIPRKRVDWLIHALASVTRQSFELWLVGTGSEESALRTLASSKLGDRVRWLGQLPLPDVPAVMAQTDCLVLPSVHDGWGAVASEALMVGTPVICSDACGVAGVVNASRNGGVFPVNDLAAFGQLLDWQMAQGPLSDDARHGLAVWASCLGSDAGAVYLENILMYAMAGSGSRPTAPWLDS